MTPNLAENRPRPRGTATETATQTTTTGFSLSCAGFLCVYHLGVLEALSEHGFVKEETPLVGSSGGALAVVAFALGRSKDALESTVRISDHCHAAGGAFGRLMGPLRKELDSMLPPNTHEILRRRRGFTGVCYTQFFPYAGSVVRHRFDDSEDVKDTLCDSCMFPFLSANKLFLVRKPRRRTANETTTTSPEKKKEEDDEASFSWIVALRPSRWIRALSRWTTASSPRLVADGLLSVSPRSRFGCPHFPPEAGTIERTVTVSVLPHDYTGLVSTQPNDRISPRPREGRTERELFRERMYLLSHPSRPERFVELFEEGKRDALRWIALEKERTQSF